MYLKFSFWSILKIFCVLLWRAYLKFDSSYAADILYAKILSLLQLLFWNNIFFRPAISLCTTIFMTAFFKMRMTVLFSLVFHSITSPSFCMQVFEYVWGNCYFLSEENFEYFVWQKSTFLLKGMCKKKTYGFKCLLHRFIEIQAMDLLNSHQQFYFSND